MSTTRLETMLELCEEKGIRYRIYNDHTILVNGRFIYNAKTDKLMDTRQKRNLVTVGEMLGIINTVRAKNEKTGRGFR